MFFFHFNYFAYKNSSRLIGEYIYIYMEMRLFYWNLFVLHFQLIRKLFESFNFSRLRSLFRLFKS